MSVWTQAVVNRFEQLFADGLSYNDIAETLSKEFSVTISRNAAIGHGKRANMPKRKNKNNPRKPEVRLEQRRPPKLTPAPYVPRPEIGKGTLRIEELRFDSCRWPFGDRSPLLYCGCKAIEGKAYCEAHMKLGHVRWQPTAAA